MISMIYSAITYNAGYLTASTGNFTIASSADWDVKYTENGQTITIDFAVVNATLTSDTANVRLDLPFNNNFNGTFYAVAEYANSNNTLQKRMRTNYGSRWRKYFIYPAHW
jgi:hypothetical protein